MGSTPAASRSRNNRYAYENRLIALKNIENAPLRIISWTKIRHNKCESRGADPHGFDADPDPPFHSNAEPVPIFRLNGSDANLRPPVYRPFWASFWTSTLPLWATTSLHGSIMNL